MPRAGNIARIRIIAGRWRGRRIAVPDGPDLRPTLDQTRETLFNWLAPDISGARCLDLFAGSGALGFEACSRGAASVTLVENSKPAVRHLQDTVRLLEAADTLQVVRADSFRWLKEAQGAFDIIFLDPPWRLRAVPRLLEAISESELLAADGYVYFEAERDDPVDLPPAWELLRDKRAGQSRYGLLARAENEGTAAPEVL